MKGVALLYIVLVGFLTVQPLLALRQSKQVDTCCKKEACTKKDSEPKKDGDCQDKPCNPFIACAYGNFFFLSNNRIVFGNLPLNKLETYTFNDNRLSSVPSECWHPPQV